MKSTYTDEEKNLTALAIMKGVVLKTKANRKEMPSDWVPSREKGTGIHRSELVRFVRAVVTNDMENSFPITRACEIARALFKYGIAGYGKMPNKSILDDMAEFSLLYGVKKVVMFELVRDICHEIVDTAFETYPKKE